VTNFIKRAIILDAVHVANLRAYAAMLEAESVLWSALARAESSEAKRAHKKKRWNFSINQKRYEAEAMAVRLEAQQIEARHLAFQSNI
jgi:hypothetical protein